MQINLRGATYTRLKLGAVQPVQKSVSSLLATSELTIKLLPQSSNGKVHSNNQQSTCRNAKINVYAESPIIVHKMFWGLNKKSAMISICEIHIYIDSESFRQSQIHGEM